MLKLLDGVFITIGFKTQAAHARHGTHFPPPHSCARAQCTRTSVAFL